MKGTDNNKWGSIVMCFLALYPVLYAYNSTLSLNYGETVFLLLIFVALIYNKKKLSIKIPRSYYVFWGYVAVLLIVFSDSFKITNFVPGGVAFTLFSLMLGVCACYFDIDKLYKIMRGIFLFASLIFIFQKTGILRGNYSEVFILPISDHIAYSGIDLDTVISRRMGANRPASIFLEPAYFGQFCSIFLMLELFYKANSRIFTKMAIFIILMMLIVRSGCALIGLATILAYKVISVFKSKGGTKIHLLLLLPVVAIAGQYYLLSDMGVELMERTQELDTEGTSGYLRVIQGFYIYDYLPSFNKIFGISADELGKTNFPFLKVDAYGEVSFFTNGLFTLLIRTGLVGLVLLLYFYLKLFKESNDLGRASLLLILSFSLVEQIYLLFPMLLCTVISINQKKNEGRLSFSVSSI